MWESSEPLPEDFRVPFEDQSILFALTKVEKALLFYLKSVWKRP